MDLLKLLLLFGVIVVMLWRKRPLWQAILAGLLYLGIVYQIAPFHWPQLVSKVFRDQSSLSILLSLYLITYLQRMLEARQQLRYAQADLNGLFHNRRINAAGAPMFIGLLPSAAAMILYCEGCHRGLFTAKGTGICNQLVPSYTGKHAANLCQRTVDGKSGECGTDRFYSGDDNTDIVFDSIGLFSVFTATAQGSGNSEKRASIFGFASSHAASLDLAYDLSVDPDFSIIRGRCCSDGHWNSRNHLSLFFRGINSDATQRI